MKRPNRKDYINKATKIKLIADQELYIDHLEKEVKRACETKLKDSDIATVEAMHDVLFDKHGYCTDDMILKRSRELTSKMYSILKDQ